ncbi:MAG: hypothetical protein ACLP53_22750 [Isosphaeraceae bacterium]
MTHTQATGRTLVEALDQFSQRLPAGAAQEASLGLGRVERSRLQLQPAATSASVSEPAGGAPAVSALQTRVGTGRA